VSKGPGQLATVFIAGHTLCITGLSFTSVDNTDNKSTRIAMYQENIGIIME